MTILIDNSKAVEISIREWDEENTQYGLDWSADFYDVGRLKTVDGNLMQEAEVVEDVYGENEEELEKRANELLAAYGLKLGKFDEATGDRWELVEA